MSSPPGDFMSFSSKSRVVMLGVKHRASYFQGKHSTSKLHPPTLHEKYLRWIPCSVVQASDLCAIINIQNKFSWSIIYKSERDKTKLQKSLHEITCNYQPSDPGTTLASFMLQRPTRSSPSLHLCPHSLPAQLSYHLSKLLISSFLFHLWLFFF